MAAEPSDHRLEVWIHQAECSHWSFWLQEPPGVGAKKCIVADHVVGGWIRSFQAADAVEFQLQDVYDAS